MVHEQFDLGKFQSIFPLAALRQKARDFVLARQKDDPSLYKNDEEVQKHIKLMEPGGEIVTSPYDIAVVEQLREEVATDLEEMERIPTDVFVFAKGEPTDRRITKVGGLPYWPKNAEWPISPNGRPMEFLAQFCFADSRFIFDDLPGDMLVIFKPAKESDVEAFECHWLTTKKETLVANKDIPANSTLIPVYGTLHRSYDYVDSPPCLARYRFAYHLAQIEGTKVGGIPRWIQRDEGLPGRFLCTLGSIQPVSDKPFPFVNVPEPYGMFDPECDRMPMWGDVGSIYFFIDDNGKVNWTWQCY